MMRRTTFLISALCLLILANVLMMSYASPAFSTSGEGFVAHMEKYANMGMRSSQNFKDASGANPTNASGKKMEKFANYSGAPGGAKSSYEPIGVFDNVKLQSGNSVSEWRYTAPNEPLQGNFPKFEPGPDNLFMFKDNQCKPECCGASFSCDGGCVCTTPEQRSFIAHRGGNRTSPESGV